MIIYSCDCCGIKIDNRMYELKLLKHITEQSSIFIGHSKLIDGRFEPISGIHKNFDLCLVCYNKIHYKTFEIFNELKNYKDIKILSPEDTIFYEGENPPKLKNKYGKNKK